MTQIPSIEDARKITQDEITKGSNQICTLVVDALNEAAKKGKYNATVELTKEQVPFGSYVIDIMKTTGYEVRCDVYDHDKGGECVRTQIQFSWKPEKKK